MVLKLRNVNVSSSASANRVTPRAIQRRQNVSASFAAFDWSRSKLSRFQCVTSNQKNGFFLVRNGANSGLAFNVYRNLNLNASPR